MTSPWPSPVPTLSPLKILGVLRTNGTNSVLIQNGSSHVRFEHCRLGHVVSPVTSVDAYLTFRFNNMEGYDLNLQHPDGSSAGEVIVENNFVRNVFITNSGPVWVKNNRVSNVSLYAQDFTINRSNNIEVSGNRMRRLIVNNDVSVSVHDNTIYCDDNRNFTPFPGVYAENSKLIKISSNHITQRNSASFQASSRGVELVNSSSCLVFNNSIYVYSSGGNDPGNNIGIYTRGPSTKNITIKSNTIENSSYADARYGIMINNGDSICVRNNIMDGLNHKVPGQGIVCTDVIRVADIDSNTVRNYQNRGLHAKVSSATSIFRYNRFENIRDLGIYLEGSKGVLTNNTVTGVVNGNGIQIIASNSTVSENRFLNIQAGTGIVVNGAGNLVANNFIEAEGVGIAKGISLQSNGSGSKIVFNSVNITGTDVVNGVALEVLGGSNYVVKNNIFANNGGGYASFTKDSLKGDFDYNNYYSTKRKLARYVNTDYTDISSLRNATGQEDNGFAKNPFFSSDTLLQMNQVLLNDAAVSGTGITNDIEPTVRGASPDLGAKEYTPCSLDAGVNEFTGLVNPLAVGTQPLKVELQNQGTNPLTSAVIHWEVNGTSQTPYNWTGTLGYKGNTEVIIGSYTFQGGESYKLKAWTVSPNGGADCNHDNDTIKAFDLATPMCGIYTIGGTDPDFTSFTDAAIALNNAGITCPVIFKVRDGVYDEQIKLYQIIGSSATNTITFMGESGDSSKVELHYKTSNPSNDFTLALTGTDFIAFKELGVLRTNGTNSVLIQNGSSHVRFEHCRLGHVVSPVTSVDAYLTFRFNNMEGYDLNLQHPDGSSAGEVIVENNFVRNVFITNSGPVWVKNNRVSNVSLYAQDFTINRSNNIEVSGNRMRRLIVNNDVSVSVHDNTIYCDDNRNFTPFPGVYAENSKLIKISSNHITQRNSASFQASSRGVELVNSSSCLVFNNSIYVYSSGGNDPGNNIGIYTRGPSTKNITIKSNTIENSSYADARYGIMINNGDSICVRNNIMDGLNHKVPGQGIVCTDVIRVADIDSNTVRNYQNRGLHAKVSSATSIFRYNRFENIRDLGIYLEGSKGVLTNNTVTGVVNGNGIQIIASNSTVSENRFLNIQAGTGIVVNGAGNLVANNFIEAEGVGIAKGISLQSNGSGSKIVFNSVNITGTDVVNGVALEVLGGSNYVVKNNIFANNGGGYASFTKDSLKGDFDYNNYYSTKRKLARYVNTDYTDISSLRNATGQEDNGFAKNPFFSSDTLLQMNQVLLNDAAVSGTGITNDIEPTVRGASPDLGAKEYTPCSLDAGVNEFTGLVNPLAVGTQPLKVELQNQGTNPLTSAVIHWEVNGTSQTPYNWTGTLGYKGNTEVIIGSYTFQGGESYKLKAWTVSPNGGADCNHDNDTIKAFDLATPMCGIYTIGGTDPDFTSFTDAAIALNNAGITCPVIFKVRDGVYDEQIKLYQIIGSSATNTITFMGESGDSSKVELHYKTSNPSNDFTLALTGTDFIAFKELGILRTNGTNSVLIQNGSSHVRFEHCRLGHVVSPVTSVDAYLTFRFNNMEGYDLNLQHPDGSSAGEVIVENNFVRNVFITNSGPVWVKNNRVSNVSLYAQDFTINRSNNIEVSGNRMRRLIVNNDVSVSVHDNTIYCDDNRNFTPFPGVYAENSKLIKISSNHITQRNSASFQASSRGVRISKLHPVWFLIIAFMCTVVAVMTRVIISEFIPVDLPQRILPLKAIPLKIAPMLMPDMVL